MLSVTKPSSRSREDTREREEKRREEKRRERERERERENSGFVPRQICKRLCVGAKLKSPFDALEGGRFETRKGGRANISCFFVLLHSSSSFRCTCRNRQATVAPACPAGGVAETLRGEREKWQSDACRYFRVIVFFVDVEGDGPSFSFLNGKIWRLLQIPM